jgi:hypothetical protein
MARAASVTGPVRLSNGNGLSHFALERGYPLNPGDQVDTRGGGRLVIELSDGSVVLVQPETILVIKDFRAAESIRELFEITIGLVRVQINRFRGRSNPYRINSPSASVAVRGTAFTVAVDVEQQTKVEVFEGTVAVTPRGDPDRAVAVDAGYGILVQASGNLQLYRLAGGQLPIAQGRVAGSRPPFPASTDRGQSSLPAPQGPSPRNSGPDRRSPHDGKQQIPRERPGAIQRRNFRGAPSDGHGAVVQRDPFRESRRAIASTYDRYMDNIAGTSDAPGQFRFTASPDPHLDSLENPAYAVAFQRMEARLLLMPAWGGFGFSSPRSHSVATQISLFAPAWRNRLVLGLSVTPSQYGDSLPPDVNSGALSTAARLGGRFTSTSLLAAIRLSAANSLGFAFEAGRGTGSLLSSTDRLDVSQTATDSAGSDSNLKQSRVTLGFSRNLSPHHTLGAVATYGLVEAADAVRFGLPRVMPTPTQLRASGHSTELALRLRGMIAPRLSYGAVVSLLSLSLTGDSRGSPAPPFHQRGRWRRGSVALGLGYQLGGRTFLNFDVVGGTSILSSARTESSPGNANTHRRFAAFHAAMQRDLSRKLFVSASLIGGVRSNPGTMLAVASPVVPQTRRITDLGVGWHFQPGWVVQYLYSPAQDRAPGGHALALRYCFSPRGE